eukprot:scaffold34349_cov38-Attheya_sp.AAC.1
MRFSATTVLLAIATASSVEAFVPQAGYRQALNQPSVGAAFVNSNSHVARGAMSMDLSDLESKLLTPVPASTRGPAPKAAAAAPKKAAPKKERPEKKKPAPKVSRKQEDKLAKELAAVKAADEAASVAAVAKPAAAPVKSKGKVKEASYDVDVVKPKPKKQVVLKAATKTNPKIDRSINISLPKVSLPKVSIPKFGGAAPKAKVPGPPAEPNAQSLGFALGAAPLLAVPILGLAAVRGALGGTVKRREAIQKQIAEEAAAKAAREAAKKTDVDGGALAGAIGFLGASAAAVGLIVTAPFANMEAPSISRPSGGSGGAPTEKVVKAPRVKVEKAPRVMAVKAPPKEKVIWGKASSSSKAAVPKKADRSGYNFDGATAPEKVKAAPVVKAAPAPKVEKPAPAPKPVKAPVVKAEKPVKAPVVKAEKPVKAPKPTPVKAEKKAPVNKAAEKAAATEKAAAEKAA